MKGGRNQLQLFPVKTAASLHASVTHSERLLVDGVQRLLLHRRLLLTVTRQVWQEVGLHISGREGEKTHTHTLFLTDTAGDIAAARCHTAPLTGRSGSCAPRRCPRSGAL